MRGLAAIDLRTVKDNGTPWNFSLKKDRKEAIRLVDELDPTWIVGSPLCTAFSQWNVSMNYPKMDHEAVKGKIAEGEVHLEFVAKFYRKQYNRGRDFFHNIRLAPSHGTTQQFSDYKNCQDSMLRRPINAFTD